MWKRIAILTVPIILLSTLAIVTIATMFGQYNLISEILSHLLPEWSTLALVLTLLFIAARARVAACISIMVLVINGYPIANLYLARPHPNVSSESTKIKLLQMNLWGGKNLDYNSALSAIHKVNPDIVGISEVTPGWAKQLTNGLQDYKYRVVYPHCGGIALFSRFPIQDGKVEFGERNRPHIVAKLKIGDEFVTCIFAHPFIPLQGMFQMRNSDLAELGREAGSAKTPVILAGDLNCTQFSYYFDKLKDEGHLVDTEQGFGFHPTWSAFFPFPMVTIDHCLTSPEITTYSRAVGSKFGSDHLPVTVELGIPKIRLNL
jgi:endonuclease/exonuclease/phosphatase (EEP) superfamily protein YafD